VGPLSTLFTEIGQIGGDDYRKKLVMPYKNEIKGIAIHLNRMLWKLESLTDRHLKTQQTMYEMELSRKQTELYALQSQVNPHFLFNTLQCIGGIALSKDVPEIAHMTAYMSEIFNYGIKGDDDVQIRDEIFIVNQYLNIIDIRFAGKFRWEFDIEEEMLRRKTIKMIVQPLVENAVYHGLEKTYEDGHLLVTGKIEEGCILLEIRDNGPGMDRETLEKIRKVLADPVKLEKECINKQKIGIANIHWRIRLKYGERYGLNISSAAEGTVVQVKLPLEPNK
jgi:two-component system sensor histidine kinase YesM